MKDDKYTKWVFLFEKLCAGVAWRDLTKDEYWKVCALESEDYLYHTGYLTSFYRDRDGFFKFLRTTDGAPMIKAANEHALQMRLNVRYD